MNMKKSWMLWLLVIFLVSSFGVAAQGEVDTIISTFADFNLGEVYDKYPQFIDFLVFAVIFITISVYSLGKAFPDKKTSKILGVVIGIALTIAFTTWEYSQGASIKDFGPIASLVVMIVLGLFIYKVVSHTSIGGTYSVLLAIVVTFSLIEAYIPNIFDWLEEKGGFLLLGYSFIKVAVWISAILLIWKGAAALARAVKGSPGVEEGVKGAGKGAGKLKDWWKNKGKKDEPAKGKPAKKGKEVKPEAVKAAEAKKQAKKPYSTPSIKSVKDVEKVEKEVEKQEKYAERELYELKKIEKELKAAESVDDLKRIRKDVGKLGRIERRMVRRYNRLSKAAKELAATGPGVEEEEGIMKTMKEFRTYKNIMIVILSEGGLLDRALTYSNLVDKRWREDILGKKVTEKEAGSNFEARKTNSLKAVKAARKWDLAFYYKLKEFEEALESSISAGKAAAEKAKVKKLAGARYRGGARY